MIQKFSNCGALFGNFEGGWVGRRGGREEEEGGEEGGGRRGEEVEVEEEEFEEGEFLSGLVGMFGGRKRNF